MTENVEICEFLNWDSQFFGYKIARVTVTRLDESMIDLIMNWSCLHRIDCLYFLADADHADTIRLAESHGLHHVDVRIKFHKQLGIDTTIPPNICSQKFIRQSIFEDIPKLKAIAKINHHDSRFYYDPNFPSSICDTLYETWIEKSCNGYADVVLVAEIEGKVAGYVSCHLLDKTKGKIGLLGVSPAFRGNSLGQALVNKSFQWFSEKGITDITVITQGRNCKALRLYQKCGFLIQSLQLWYHWWFHDKIC